MCVECLYKHVYHHHVVVIYIFLGESIVISGDVTTKGSSIKAKAAKGDFEYVPLLAPKSRLVNYCELWRECFVLQLAYPKDPFVCPKKGISLTILWPGDGIFRPSRAPMTSIFEGQPPKTRNVPIKTRVIWVLGIYTHTYHAYIMQLRFDRVQFCISNGGRLVFFWIRWQKLPVIFSIL